ncbi:unnamed protein product, partial [Prorocentrum cordatum]
AGRAASGHPAAPRVARDLADRLVVEKPPGWEVDQGLSDVLGSDSVQTTDTDSSKADNKKLSGFLASVLPPRRCPIVQDAAHRRGLLHRLDVPSSGLVLAAKTYEAYYDLSLQLSVGAIARDYLVLCRGWVPPARGGVVARVRWEEGSGRPSCAGGHLGKPAESRLKVLAHVLRGPAECLSLVAVRIATGRRHQIRAHLALMGHPVACDGKYTCLDTFLADLRWCPRNFLHRYCLGFSDLDGAAVAASSPPPPDLLGVLRRLRPRGGLE